MYFLGIKWGFFLKEKYQIYEIMPKREYLQLMLITKKLSLVSVTWGKKGRLMQTFDTEH